MSDTVRPPRLAAALLAIVTPRGWAGASMAADLEEEFRQRRLRSPVRAHVWYWKAVGQVVAAYGWERMRPRRPEQGPGGPTDHSGGSNAGSTLVQDLRYALRSFRHTPGFTLVAAATLALGVGAATSVFSVADAVLLRPLPFRDADRLVQVWATRPQRGNYRTVVSGPTYLDWARDAHSFAGLAAYRAIDFNVVGGDVPERVSGLSITSDFFQVLGVSAALGRLPTPEDPNRGAGSVVLSDALWRSTFGADRSIIGRSLILNGKPRTVVAVLQPRVDFPEQARLYAPSPYRVPLAPLEDTDLSEDRSSGYLSVVGRLAPGVSLAAAQAEMTSLADAMARAYPATNAKKGVRVVSLLDDMVGGLRPTFVLILGAVGLLMLIACANVANLLTVRSTRRARELAVRVSIGASVGRVRRQLLTESVVLAFLGGVPGFLLSLLGTRLLVRLAPTGIPRLASVGVDPRVLGFALSATLLTGLVFGLAPLVGLEERATAGVLRAPGGRRGRGRAELLRDAVVVTEVAVSLLLVVGAGLMLRTVRALDAVNPGLDPKGVLAAHVTLPEAKYDTDAAIASFYNQALERIRAIPGVRSAATVLTLPMHWAVRGTFHFSVQGRSPEEADDLLAAYQVVSPGYFATLRIPLLQGRTIEESDRADAPLVALVNEAMARRYWPTGKVLGARITAWGDPKDPKTQWATVVGVVGNTVKEGLDEPPEPEMYLPMAQGPMNASTFVLRTDGNPYALVPALRRAVAEVDPGLPLYGIMSMRDVLSASLATRRFRMLVFIGFAAAALLLAAVGLYGVIGFSVALRTREIGIRMTLGAARERVVGHVVLGGLGRVGVGIVLGLAASLALQRVIASQIFGVSAADPVTYASAAGLFAIVAVVACAIPATRAAGVDPVVSVRAE